MTDVVEILSDDESDNLDKNVTKTNYSYKDKEDDSASDTDLSQILKKYSRYLSNDRKYEVRSQCEFKNINENHLYNSDDVPAIHNFKNKVDQNKINHECLFSVQDPKLLSYKDESHLAIANHDNTKSQNCDDKLMKKIMKEQEKLQKQKEKELQKQNQANAKATKQAASLALKNIKPEECTKFITTVVDVNLTTDPEYGGELTVALNTDNVLYKIVSQPFPRTITWIRKIQQSNLTTIGQQLGLTGNSEECDEILLIIQGSEIVDLVENNKLIIDIRQKQLQLHRKKLYIGIYRLGKFMSQRGANNKRGKLRHQLELALTELQIITGCSHRLLESPQDLTAMIMQFTKSIAQTPYKAQKQLQYQQMDWFVSGDNKDCVRVDPSGNGLQRLWRQQLTQFPLARLETAEAISSVYPSPVALIRAYDSCITPENAEMLLQDVSIRRAAGPLTAHRKIGPELSKKVHAVFCSLDGDTIL